MRHALILFALTSASLFAQCSPDATTGGTACPGPLRVTNAPNKRPMSMIDLSQATPAFPCLTLAQQSSSEPNPIRLCGNPTPMYDIGKGYVSLQGAKGDTGDAGPKGDTGPPGPQGKAGTMPGSFTCSSSTKKANGSTVFSGCK